MQSPPEEFNHHWLWHYSQLITMVPTIAIAIVRLFTQPKDYH